MKMVYLKLLLLFCINIFLFSLLTALTTLYYLQVQYSLTMLGKNHITFTVLFYSLAFMLTGDVVLLFYYIFYGFYGSKYLFLRSISNVCFLLSELSIILMSLLIGSGWTIVYRKLLKRERYKILITFMILFFLILYSEIARSIILIYI